MSDFQPKLPIRAVLNNGMVFLHAESHAAALVSVQVWLRTGSIHEGGLLGCGLSHFLEHMLFKGTARRSPMDISREVHAIGGYINAYTTYDRTVYYIDAPSESAEAACDILADMAFNASLPEDEFTSERDVILREIDMDQDDLDRRLFEQFTETAFRRHPYRFPIIGHRPLFESITPGDLRGYYEGRYAPANAVAVISGDITSDAAMELAQRLFGSAPMRRVREVSVEQEPPQIAPRQRRMHGSANITRGLLGYRIPGLASAESPAMEVAAALLGRGHSSRLWQRLREEQRLVHHIEASCWNPGETGLLCVGYTCDPGKREAVENAISEELSRFLDTKIAAEEVEKVVRQALVSEINATKTVSGLASRAGAAEVVAGETAWPRIRLQRLRSVTAESVLEVARRYLVDTGCTRTSLEPETSNEFVSAAASLSALPDFSEEQRPNGARLLMQPDATLPKVHLRLVLGGGALADPVDRRGATGVLSTLLARDTQQRTAAEVAALVERLGGSLNEYCGNNTFGLSLEFLSQDFDTTVELLGQALLETNFIAETFDTERDGQLAYLLEENDDPLDYGRRVLRERFFGAHPYAVDYLGRENDLRALSLEDVHSLYQHFVTAPNAVLAVAGQFDPAVVGPRLAALLDSLPAGQACPEPSAFDGPAAQELITERVHRDQAIVLAGYLDTGLRGEDYYCSELLDELFSGMSSELFRRVREEKGLAYFVASSRVVGLDCGLFYFYAGTHPDKVAEVEAEFAAEIQRVQTGEFREGELEACRLRQKVRKRNARQAPGSRAMEAALDVTYGRPANNWRDYDARIDEVTAERLAAHALRLFSAPPVRVHVLPKE